jgi:hypothetical protein
MATPPDKQDRPARGTGRPGADSGQSASSVQILADLILELRPDIPLSIAESLVCEALDAAADAILDLEWARTRARLYPDAVRLAHGRHMAPYAVRRARELATARQPRPGDFHGLECQCIDCCPGHDLPMCPEACRPNLTCWQDPDGELNVECRPPRGEAA